MNRRALAVAVVAAVLVVGVVLFLTHRAARTGSAVPSGPAPASSGGKPASAVAADAAPRVARRAPRSTRDAGEPATGAEAVPELGTLRIEADVPGAQVFLDRQFIGTTPLTTANVRPGTHQLHVSAEGFDGFSQSIDVEPGPRDLAFRFREVRLDATLAVVHKHRMGSCTGRLVATVDGVRYETANTDDSFSVGLADLETFEVAYQEKNLKITLRRGRQFNFTDPDGNADRLFVFHRDVEKARQKLGL